MTVERKSGILLHPTCLPNTPGIGTIGKEAYKFVDWLEKIGQTLWQILPLGPTGYGDSPYASFSTFAGNPLMVDLDDLVLRGWGEANCIVPPDYISCEGPIDFGSVVWWKIPVLKSCAEYFLQKASAQDKKLFKDFVKKQGYWLDNYALFMSIKEFYDKKAQEEDKFGAMWSNYWPKELATCKEDALNEWKEHNKQSIEIQKVIQFFFFTQWAALKKYANEKGILIIGDIPIFVAADSADVWANQSLFQLDEEGRAKAVAGVPPDYFSATGQLWGNPLYDWEAMAKTKYEWWISRIKATLALVDYIRIDHFRGFEAYWSVSAGETTAINGKWVPGPDHDLFKVIKKKLGDIPIIAEDLGLITEGVQKLRDDFNLPGMKVIQFAFDLKEAGSGGFVNPFLPHMYTENCVAYTGTHDNETMVGWLDQASEEEIALVKKYVNAPEQCSNKDLGLLLVRAGIASVAKFAIFPLQDLYGIGHEGRINTPSTSDGKNWIWRMSSDLLDNKTALWLKDICNLYGRNIKKVEE